MNSPTCDERWSTMTSEFNEHQQRRDGQAIVSALAASLPHLKRLAIARVRSDVDRAVGTDSFYVADAKKEALAATEIGRYLVIEARACIEDRGYLSVTDGWLLDWLASFCLDDADLAGTAAEQLRECNRWPAHRRRTELMNSLERILPTARRAPLVLYRILPLAAWVAASLAFNDSQGAIQAREKQISLLPHIRDCKTCHGAILEPGQICSGCGNPLWMYEWLTSD